ncbi:hypothetical protein WJ0W_001526 [Paenibacillus melissococcoides]|uniref:Fe/B12 periplasmic-binding domain-containing protein n=1 Tax=Paenibacillus melissococcoides TaxID=2912268 RepID=A0ABN8U3J0_9BACL|nr:MULTISPECIES: hypothetical protein [Paenibacillus]MEB9893427.1 hypothetical protein [Bacillus cereus]CAH8244288.1 hypothetical protein WJ0W_001526 [Paenibacillus melissococcoides]CAH8703501.1 hypothetical protein HTL2_000141 [Paenibacillus melissococcoides]CAH8705918.1 hypothetical protein WDD9_001102 [Paenibacillus melissococcoides]GIO77651.1 hypothetical protein J6TS7_12610 [Paenibacillus dendritiformis]
MRPTGRSLCSADQTPATRMVKESQGEVEIPAHPMRIADIDFEGQAESGYPDCRLVPDSGHIQAVAAAEPDLILRGPTQSTLCDELAKIAPTVQVPYSFTAFRERFA